MTALANLRLIAASPSPIPLSPSDAAELVAMIERPSITSILSDPRDVALDLAGDPE